MIRFIPVLAIGFIFYFVYVQALECGIAENLGDANLQNVLKKCSAKKAEDSGEKSEKATTASSDSSEESGQQTSGARRGLNSRIRRSNAFEKRDTTSSGSENDENDHSGQNSNDTMASEKCALQCIFVHLGMTDANGYPDHNRVAQTLLKNAKGRELRDFLQDSTDECFQLMEQGEKLDSCEYVTHLVTCMAEKGRSNCADWKVTDLPFHS